MSKFVQITCSDSPDTEGVRQGGPSCWALDDEGRVWFYNNRRDDAGPAWEQCTDRRVSFDTIERERGRRT
jgi:hypothetical protein